MKPEPGCEFKHVFSDRIPSLDGLRALSIGLVLAMHSGIYQVDNVPALLRPLLLFFVNGPLGVSIFFVISGFLITTLLLREADETGGIRLRDFYVRRTFRILPACYVYLGVLLVLKGLGAASVLPEGWFSASVFLRNYLLPVEGMDWNTAHFWSLSVEEQFYLFWPVGLILLGRRRAAWLAAGLIVSAPLIRMVTFAELTDRRPEIGYMTHTRVDTLMFGCLTALLARSEAFQKAVRRGFALRLPLLAAAGLFVVSPLLQRTFQGRYLFTVGYTLEGIGIVLVLLWVIERPETRIGRLLNSRFLIHVGMLSYSLYLWQQCLLRTTSFWSLAATIVAAECSFHLIERPALRLRKRWPGSNRPPRPLAADSAPVGLLLTKSAA